MKKSYSKLNILQEKLLNRGEKKGLWGYLFDTHRYIEISIDYYAYLRGKVFVEDLKDNFGEEVPYSLDMAYLLYMLYTDFLTQVKRGVSHEEVAAYLKQGKGRYFQVPRKERRVMKALTKHLLEFSTIEEEEENVPVEEKRAYISLRMREKEVLRCEILLYDLQSFLKGCEITVEEVITIVYMDFISSITSEGNSLKVQKTILAYLQTTR